MTNILQEICRSSLLTIRFIFRDPWTLKNFIESVQKISQQFFATTAAISTPVLWLSLGSAIAEMMGKRGLIDGEKLLPPHLKPQSSGI